MRSSRPARRYGMKPRGSVSRMLLKRDALPRKRLTRFDSGGRTSQRHWSNLAAVRDFN